MSEKVPNKVIDVTNVELTPGDSAGCLGNRKNGFECCCDECDYFLLCFPEFEPKTKKKEMTKIQSTIDHWKKERCHVLCR